jgi:hypothetical protein
MRYIDDRPYKPLDPVYKPQPLYEPIKIDPLPTYKPLNLDPVYKPQPLYEPIKVDPLPTYKPLNLDPVYKPQSLYEPIKVDPLPTYKLPETKPLIGRWCSKKGTWCSEPVCRRTYGLPGKHAHTHLTGHHRLW